MSLLESMGLLAIVVLMPHILATLFRAEHAIARRLIAPRRARVGPPCVLPATVAAGKAAHGPDRYEMAARILMEDRAIQHAVERARSRCDRRAVPERTLVGPDDRLSAIGAYSALVATRVHAAMEAMDHGADLASDLRTLQALGNVLRVTATRPASAGTGAAASPSALPAARQPRG